MDIKKSQDLVKEGWIKVKVIVEVAGFPEEHVSKALEMIVKKMSEEFKVLKKELAEPKKTGDKLFTAFIEFEVLVESLSDLLGLAFDYTPSSIEIIEPEKIKDSSQSVTDLLNDLVAKLHAYSMLLQQLKAENIIMKKKLGLIEKKAEK